jgi:hypothetical protein
VALVYVALFFLCAVPVIVVGFVFASNWHGVADASASGAASTKLRRTLPLSLLWIPGPRYLRVVGIAMVLLGLVAISAVLYIAFTAH